MSLEVGIKTKLNAKLVIRQRANLFGANISANKISLSQDQSYSERIVLDLNRNSALIGIFFGIALRYLYFRFLPSAVRSFAKIY